MHSDVETIPSVQVYRHRSIGLPLAKALTGDLQAAGFRAQLREEPFGAQQAADWALPAFTTPVTDSWLRPGAARHPHPGQTLVW